MSHEDCEKIPIITQGQRKVLNIRVTKANGDNDDLSNVTKIVFFAEDTVGGFLTKKDDDAVDPPSVIGGTSKVEVPISQDESKTLKVDPRHTIFLSLDFPLPKGRQILKVVDAFGVCEAKFEVT